MSKHTATPWRVSTERWIHCESGECVAVTSDVPRSGENAVTCQLRYTADARLIVRAVNNHEALVGAVTAARELILTGEGNEMDIADQCGAALALARGDDDEV